MAENDIRKKPLSIYLHFPFCVKKCSYCDFLSFSADGSVREDYIAKLIEEIACRSGGFRGRPVRTVFIGGGTPSLMSKDQLSRLMGAVYRYYEVEDQAEISMECNPGTVCCAGMRPCEPARLSFADIRDCGINRLSIGLQSMDDGELRLLGRIHSSQQFLESYDAARGAGFTNINVDLMSGLPGQSLGSWMNTLERVCALSPEHISAYSLIIEEGTPFYKLYGCGEEAGRADCPALPDEDTERGMYHLARHFLRDNGYTHYEISNFSKPGCECRHNLTYWYRGDYLGMGLGAASLTDGCRSADTADLDIYMKTKAAPGAFLEKPLCAELSRLSRQEQMEETMFLGLRCRSGVGIRHFERVFGESIYSVYGAVIENYVRTGMIRDDGKRISLTAGGIDVSNWILSDFLIG